MAIISANLQFNRGGHGLLDYSSLQTNYSKALEWAKDPNSNAAVGQFIYLESAETIGDVEYAKGPYVVDAIGENAIITPLSKSVAGSPDLASEVSDLKSSLSKVDTSIASLEATVGNDNSGLVGDVADLKEAMDALPKTFVTDVKDASGNSVVVEGVVTLGDYATKEDVSTGLATKADASTTYTKKEVDDAIAGVIGQIPDAPFQSVADEDNILTLDENGVLKSDLTFDKETIDGAEYLVVKGKNGVEIGKVATAEFTVDGILDDVDWSTTPGKENFLVLTFNTGANKTPIEVDFGKYVDAYSAGNGLTLTDKAFAVDFTKVEAAGAAATVKSEIEGKLDDYALVANVYSKTDADNTFVKYDGYVEYTQTEKDKLYGIAEGAEVNVVKEVDTTGVLGLDASGKLSADLSAYALSATVDGSLAKKVDAVEGSSLVSDALIAKLNNMVEIKSVGGDLTFADGTLSVDLSGKLDASAKVNGVLFANGEATLDAADIKLNAVIGKKEVDGTQVDRYTTDNNIQYVLNDIDTRIDAINTTIDNVTGGGVIADITAGDGINVDKTTKTNPTVSVKVDDLSVKIDSNAKVALKVSDADKQALEVKDDGVYVQDMRSYWEAI